MIVKREVPVFIISENYQNCSQDCPFWDEGMCLLFSQSCGMNFEKSEKTGELVRVARVPRCLQGLG